MAGQRILITGGNSGIGLVAARAPDRAGHEAVMAHGDPEPPQRARTGAA